jgi:hypothetical protein
MAGGGHAMAYDSDRGVAVLFGGASEFGFNSQETWEWDGQSWSLRSESGPSARFLHAMAYDPSAKRTILFGGSPDSPNGVWTWDGVSWTFHISIGPRSVSRHCMVYDPANHVTILDGGYYANETWELRLRNGPELEWLPTLPSVTVGQSTTIEVHATGTGALHYQWRKDALALSDGPSIAGANTSTLHVTPQSIQDQGYYDVLVWDDSCTQYSNSRWLNVISNGDVNADGRVNVFDVLIVVANWGIQCNGCPADVTENGSVNVSDLLYVLIRWTG